MTTNDKLSQFLLLLFMPSSVPSTLPFPPSYPSHPLLLLSLPPLLLSPQTNRASAQGDYEGATAASRHALWLSVLSIVFGIITYICAIAALISYLSVKPP